MPAQQQAPAAMPANPAAMPAGAAMPANPAAMPANPAAAGGMPQMTPELMAVMQDPQMQQMIAVLFVPRCIFVESSVSTAVLVVYTADTVDLVGVAAQAIQQNPTMLPNILQQIQQSNPELMQQIAANQVKS